MNVVFASDGITPYLYFSTRREIRKIDLRQGLNYSIVMSRLGDAIGLDFDWVGQRLYWSDVNADKISRCYLNGTGREDIVTTGLLMTEG